MASVKEGKCCGEPNVIGVEYAYGHPQRYDGISEHHCLSCDTREGRWTGKILAGGESEPRFGGANA